MKKMNHYAKVTPYERSSWAYGFKDWLLPLPLVLFSCFPCKKLPVGKAVTEKNV